MASTTQHNQQLKDFLAFKALPIIDLRSLSSYVQGHICGSSHFAVASIIERMFELPTKLQELRLVGSDEQLQRASQLLEEKGYQIKACLLWQDGFISWLDKNRLLEVGDHSTRLWSPATIVKDFVSYLQTNTKITPENKVNHRALDIACGAGRDSVYLAMQGWEVHSVDYQSGSLEKTNLLAKRYGVEVNTYQIDLELSAGNLKEKKSLQEKVSPNSLLSNTDWKNDLISPLDNIFGEFKLILVVRYLHRPLLHSIKQKIAPGGFVLYQTFMRGCEKFGRPKNPRFLLEENELAEIFNDFEIIWNDVRYLPDGRPTNIFLAQRSY